MNLILNFYQISAQFQFWLTNQSYKDSTAALKIGILIYWFFLMKRISQICRPKFWKLPNGAFDNELLERLHIFVYSYEHETLLNSFIPNKTIWIWNKTTIFTQLVWTDFVSTLLYELIFRVWDIKEFHCCWLWSSVERFFFFFFTS